MVGYVTIRRYGTLTCVARVAMLCGLMENKRILENRGFTDFAPIWVNVSRFPAALYCSRLSKYHLYHTAHTPVLMLAAHGL